MVQLFSNARFIGDNYFIKIPITSEDLGTNKRDACVDIAKAIRYHYAQNTYNYERNIEVKLSPVKLVIKTNDHIQRYGVTPNVTEWIKGLKKGKQSIDEQEVLYLTRDNHYMEPDICLGFCLGLPKSPTGTWLFNHQEHQYQQVSKHSDVELSSIDIAKRICKQFGLDYEAICMQHGENYRKELLLDIDNRGPYLVLRYDEEIK